MTTIIDYGIGNLRSVEKALAHVGAEVERTDEPARIAAAERIVLPGVGAFGACIGEIRRRGLEAPIRSAVDAGTPLLGVCVGLQLLFEESTEGGTHTGLGLLPGRVVRFNEFGEAGPDDAPLKVPHVGWNTVHPARSSPLLGGIEDGAHFYFVHSYHAAAARPADVLATTPYGVDFPAIVHRNNVFGVQFHPEKSHRSGLRILKNFSKRRRVEEATS